MRINKGRTKDETRYNTTHGYIGLIDFNSLLIESQVDR